MDLTTITEFRRPLDRADAVPRDGEGVLAGGTWLFSTPHDHLTGLVDLTALGWEPVTITETGLSLAATCTLARVSRLAAELPAEWSAHPLFAQCCEALLASFKVWNLATIGGNVCNALPAGALISLCTALDVDGVIWTPDGGERRMPVAELVTGPLTTALERGEILRSLEFPLRALRARTAFRKIALSPLGRSGIVVIGRLDENGAAVFAITAAVPAPVVLRFAALPDAQELAAAIEAVPEWYADAHGAADWRHAMSALLAEQIRVELAEAATAAGASSEDATT